MNIDREVVKQVLDALYLWHMTDGETKELMPAFNALRDAFLEAEALEVTLEISQSQITNSKMFET